MQRPYTINELKALLTPIFRSYHVQSAILFGSYSKGKATTQSDIGILVDSRLRGMQFFGLLEDVCTATDCKVDLIDIVDIVPNSSLEAEIYQSGIAIYG